MSVNYELGNPFERARGILRRCAERLEEATPDGFLAEIMNAVGVCDGNPYVRDILLEQKAELEREHACYCSHAERLVGELEQLREGAAELGRRPKDAEKDLLLGYGESASSYDRAPYYPPTLEQFVNVGRTEVTPGERTVMLERLLNFENDDVTTTFACIRDRCV